MICPLLFENAVYEGDAQVDWPPALNVKPQGCSIIPLSPRQGCISAEVTLLAENWPLLRVLSLTSVDIDNAEVRAHVSQWVAADVASDVGQGLRNLHRPSLYNVYFMFFLVCVAIVLTFGDGRSGATGWILRDGGL